MPSGVLYLLCVLVRLLCVEYREEKKHLPIKFEAPTFEGGKKGHQLYGANWQQHINQLLRQRYGNVRGIQAESGQQQGQSKEIIQQEQQSNAAGQQKSEEKAGVKEKEKASKATGEKAGK